VLHLPYASHVHMFAFFSDMLKKEPGMEDDRLGAGSAVMPGADPVAPGSAPSQQQVSLDGGLGRMHRVLNRLFACTGGR